MTNTNTGGVAHETLQRINDEYPTHHWTDQELYELVSQKDGVITGLEEMLMDLEILGGFDLDDIGPAGLVNDAGKKP